MTTPQLRELPDGGLAAFFDAHGNMIDDASSAASVRVTYEDGRVVWGTRKAGDGEKRVGAKYSDDQPRDDHGRWTDAGGGGGDGGSERHPYASPQGELGGAGVGPSKPVPPTTQERIARHEDSLWSSGVAVKPTDAPVPEIEAGVGGPQSDEQWDRTLTTAVDEFTRLRDEHGLDLNKLGPTKIALSRHDLNDPHTGGLTEIDHEGRSTIYLLNPDECAAQFDRGPADGSDVIHIADVVGVPGVGAAVVGAHTEPTPGFSIAFQEARNADEYRASVFRHELGHALAATTNAMEYVGKTFFTAKRGQVRAGYDPKVFLDIWVPLHVSTYAGQHKMEALAEMFAKYTSPRYPSGFKEPLPREWERVMDHMLGKPDVKPPRARRRGVVWLYRVPTKDGPMRFEPSRFDWSDPDEDVRGWVEDSDWDEFEQAPGDGEKERD
jgi:hypothetical protein